MHNQPFTIVLPFENSKPGLVFTLVLKMYLLETEFGHKDVLKADTYKQANTETISQLLIL